MKATSALGKALDARYIQGRVAYLRAEPGERPFVSGVPLAANEQRALPGPAWPPHAARGLPGLQGPDSTEQVPARRPVGLDLQPRHPEEAGRSVPRVLQEGAPRRGSGSDACGWVAARTEQRVRGKPQLRVAPQARGQTWGIPSPRAAPPGSPPGASTHPRPARLPEAEEPQGAASLFLKTAGGSRPPSPPPAAASSHPARTGGARVTQTLSPTVPSKPGSRV